MNYQPGFPKTMMHPSYTPAMLSQTNYAGHGDRYAPVIVHTPEMEESERARGYLNPGEAPPVVHHAEFPKMLRHPEHREAIPATQEALIDSGSIRWVPVPAVPVHLPDVLVETPEDEREWRAKGYGPAGHWDEGAFERAKSAPIPEGYDPQEWPKDIDGVIYEDPNAIPPEVLERQRREYPKWVGGEKGRVVNNLDEEREFLNSAAAVLEATVRTAVTPAHQPYVTPAPPQGILDAATLKREIVGELAPMLKDMIREALAPERRVVGEPATEEMRPNEIWQRDGVPVRRARKPMSQATKDAMAAGRRRAAAKRRAPNAGEQSPKGHARVQGENPSFGIEEGAEGQEPQQGNSHCDE